MFNILDAQWSSEHAHGEDSLIISWCENNLKRNPYTD